MRIGIVPLISMSPVPGTMLAHNVIVIPSLSCVQLFAVPWAFLSFIVSQILLEFSPLIPWCYLIISSSAPAPFSSCLQSLPASGFFPKSWLFPSGGQSIGALAKVLPMNFQGWFPLGLTGLILLSKGLSSVFSSTTIGKHQFFGAQSSLWSNSHICTWLLEKP